MTLLLFSPPPGLTFPIKRRPLWNTFTSIAVSGMDNPVQLQSYPRWQHELPFSMLRTSQAEQQYMETFYNLVGGRARAWLFDNVDDDTAVDQSLGTGDGVTRQFALRRTRPAGGLVFFEPVFAVQTPIVVKVGGAVTAAFTLGSRGLITFTSAPALNATITWSGKYYWVCRFDDDDLEFSKFNSDMWELGKLSFTSLKLVSA